jgi:hypothetical protein
MKLIQPNCRVQFTAEDIAFVVSVLGSGSQKDHLTALLTDPESRDLILDDEAIYHALLEEGSCLRVSTHLYFYVLVRHVLKDAGVEDRNVADYVAEVLSEFLHEERTHVMHGQQSLQYFFEMLAALQQVDERTRFLLRAHIGNHSLFLAGLFPERIRFRAEHKGFPDLRYYQELGRANFRVASDHRLAQRYELSSVFHTLADCFEPTRLALNDLSERVLSLGDPEVPGAYLLGGPEK